jgi:hypothetical protein
MVLRIPALDCGIVVLVQQQPFVAAGIAPPGTHQNESTTQLVSEHVEVQLTTLHRPSWVGVLAVRVRPPSARVPDDHIAAAVLAGRDHAFEVDVLDRVILDVERRAADVRIQRRALRDCPTNQDVVDLQPEVKVQAPCPVPLDHEAAIHGVALAVLQPGSRRLRSLREVPLASVGRKRVAADGGRSIRDRTRRLPACRLPVHSLLLTTSSSTPPSPVAWRVVAAVCSSVIRTCAVPVRWRRRTRPRADRRTWCPVSLPLAPPRPLVIDLTMVCLRRSQSAGHAFATSVRQSSVVRGHYCLLGIVRLAILAAVIAVD